MSRRIEQHARRTRETGHGRFEFRVAAFAVSIVLASIPGAALRALPNGEQLVAGSATVARPSAQSVVIQQNSPRAIMQWQGFSVGAQESVAFRQPGANSVMLNRVVGGQPSEIFGALSANGQIFLVNPNGVLFAPGASVNVGSMVASTLDIANQDFLDGRLRFAGTGGAVHNAGSLRAADGGTIALLGGEVSNDGTISAQLGTVALAAGARVTLDFAGDGLTRVAVTEAALGAQVRNRGALVADGGQALMTARAATALVASVVNQDGVVRANSLVERDGRIVLDAGPTGGVSVSGRVQANGTDSAARGGEIRVLGREIDIADRAAIDAGGSAGGGSVLIGRERGGDAALAAAQTVRVAEGASIAADASASGNGGRIVINSDGQTRVAGALSARGGPSGGDGGSIETSGARLDVSGARVSAGSTHGAAGEWLLDPTDIFIDSGQAAAIGGALATSNVTVETSAAGSDAGDIFVGSSIDRSSGASPTTLALRAHRSVELGDGVQIASSAGPLSVELIARKDAVSNATSGRVFMREDSAIYTNGGSVLISGGVDPRSATNGYALGPVDENGVDILYATIDTRVSAGGPAGAVEIRGRGGVTTIPLGPGPLVFGRIGVDMYYSLIEGGTVSITGSGGNALGGASSSGGSGVVIDTSTVHGEQSVTINGTGGAASATGPLASGGSGVRVIHSSAPTVAGGAVTLSGTGGSVLSASGDGGTGVAIVSENVTGTTIAITGTGGHGGTAVGGAGTGGAGVLIDDATIDASATIAIAGTGGHGWRASASSFGGQGGEGVLIEPAIVSANGAVSIDGVAGAGADAVAINATSSLTTLIESRASGGVRIVGRGPGLLEGNHGVAIGDVSGSLATTVRANDAPVYIAGHGGGNGVGVLLGEAAVIDANGANGHIELRGGSIVLPGVLLVTGAQVGSGSTAGNVVIAANVLDAPDSIELGTSGGGGTILTSGAIVLRPGTIDVAGNRVDLNAQSITLGGTPDASNPFNLSEFDLATLFPGAPGVVIGGTTHLGAISVQLPLALASNLTLQQSASAAAAGIAIGQPVTMPGNTLGIDTGGTATQAAPIVAGALLLRVGQGVSFVDPGNAVTSLAMASSGGPASFVNSGPLRLESVTATSAAGGVGGGVSALPLANSSANGAFLARTAAGNLTLNQDVSSAGGEITLVSAGLFLNSGGGALSAPAARWTVWADTWVGENRGGLVPDAPLPNLYGCTFGAPGCASGVVVPAGGNHFVYVQRPTIAFTADAAREYGLANPPLAYSNVTGLQSALGDTLADAVTGSFTTPATQTSNVGTYPITPSFSSPAGYIVDPTAGVLTITPAQLSYIATALSREYGLANPPLSGTVTGFRNGETQASATTGVLLFTTPATQSSNVGAYAITGSGLTANNGNYVLVQAPGNAGAFVIVPASLTYVATPASREYAAANPPLTGTVTGFRNGETQASATTGVLLFTTPATTTSAVGSYAIDGGGLVANNGNYLLVQAPGNATALTISGATLTYVATPAAREYGLVNPPLTGTVTGFRNGETQASATTGVLLFTTTATQASNVGTYAIDGSGLIANNYVLVQSPTNANAFSIIPATLAYVATPASREYGLVNPALSGSVTGFRNGETQASATSGVLQFASAATPASNVGTYSIAGSGLTANNGNYVLIQSPGNANAFTIVPAILSYVATPASREYGLANPSLAGTVTGFRNAETVASATTGALAFVTPATQASNVGSYAINGSGLAANNGNYAFAQAASNTTAFTITPATLVFEAVPALRVIGQPNPQLSGTVSGFRNNDTLASATTGTPAFTTTAAQSSPPGFYPITGSGLDALNYVFVQAPQNLASLAVAPPGAGTIGQVPTALRDPSMQETYVYDRNLASPGMCVAAAPLTTPYDSAPASNLLEIEWTRVRARPNLTNCVNLGDRNFCKDF